MIKKAYLTIDDSPSEEFLDKVRFLKKNKVPAIFFCRGDLIASNEKEIKFAIKDDFIIGNHSYNHKNFSKIPLKVAYKEIVTTDRIIEQLYDESKKLRPIKVFRFPYSDKGSRKIFWKNGLGLRYKKLQSFLKRMGYIQPRFEGINYPYFRNFGLNKDIDVYWTVDSLDWDTKKVSEALKKISLNKNLLSKSSNEIIVMHDHSGKLEMFEDLIKKIIDMGVKFESIPLYLR